MACGDRNAKGKPTDYVWHYVDNEDMRTVCGINGNWVYDIKEVTCKKCLKKIKQLQFGVKK
jgi:hypothetical protein